MRTWGSMPLICGGLLMCSVDEVNYNVKGVLCVLVATAPTVRIVYQIIAWYIIPGHSRV